MDDESLAAELVARTDRDQQARTRDPLDPDEMAAVDAVDAENTAWPAGLIDRQGWPLRSQVGEQEALAALLLAQHAYSGQTSPCATPGSANDRRHRKTFCVSVPGVGTSS